MTRRAHILGLVASLGMHGSDHLEPLPGEPLDVDEDVQAALLVQHTLKLECAIGNGPTTPTLLVKLAPNEIRRFSGDTYMDAAHKAIAALRHRNTVSAKYEGKPPPGRKYVTQKGQVVNRRFRRMHEALARRANKKV